MSGISSRIAHRLNEKFGYDISPPKGGRLEADAYRQQVRRESASLHKIMFNDIQALFAQSKLQLIPKSAPQENINEFFARFSQALLKFVDAKFRLLFHVAAKQNATKHLTVGLQHNLFASEGMVGIINFMGMIPKAFNKATKEHISVDGFLDLAANPLKPLIDAFTKVHVNLLNGLMEYWKDHPGQASETVSYDPQSTDEPLQFNEKLIEQAEKAVIRKIPMFSTDQGLTIPSTLTIGCPANRVVQAKGKSIVDLAHEWIVRLLKTDLRTDLEAALKNTRFDQA